MRHQKSNINRVLGLAAACMTLAALACNIPLLSGRPTATPTGEEVEEEVQERPTVDVSTLPPTTPQVVAHRPYSGEELPLDGSIDIYFDQPMDRNSVEGAIQVTPTVDTNLIWVDDSTVRISPKQQLERATRYEVTISERAQSEVGLTLEEAITLEVQTVGFLSVSEVVPAPGSGAVEPDAVITVFFNRPVVPLVIVEDMSTLPQPLSFEPDVPGEGEWLNTSIYMWKPSRPLAGGQTYTVTVAAGLEDQTGGVLEEAYTWEFTTLPPDIVSVSPSDGTRDIPLDTPIRVEFNQPMDHTSTESAFTVTDSVTGQVVSGQFEWDDEGRVLTFTPAGLLSLDGAYVVSVASTARAASGEVTLMQAYSWDFKTVLTPAVKETDPQNWESSVYPWNGIRVRFTAPIDEDTLEDKLIVEPALPEDVTFYYGTWDWSWNVNVYLEPSTTYTVTLLPGVADPYGNTIDEPYTFTFTTGPLDPMVQLNTQGGFGLYDASQTTELFTLYRNISRIDFTLARLTLEQFGRFTKREGSDLYEFSPPPDQIVRTWSVQSEGELNEAVYVRVPVVSEEGGTLEPGIYLLIADAPEIYGDIRHFMLVVTANLTHKSSFDESLVWLTDLQSGKPISGATVTLYNEFFLEVAQGTTGANGVLEIDTPHRVDLWDLQYGIVDEGGVFAISMSGWDEGISPWQFNMYSEFRFQDYSMYIYTDRPLYRPGQEVHFKGILRGKNDVTYSLPSQSEVSVSIFSDQGDEVYNKRLPLNEFGAFEGSFTLDSEASLGYYHIEAKISGYESGRGFQVAEYRKPEFIVELEPEHEAILTGDTLTVTVDAKFFFGGPVSDAEIEWTVLSDQYLFQYEGMGHYSFSDTNWDEWFWEEEGVPGFGEVIADGTGRTDANGQFVISLPASLDDVATSRRFTIEAVVTDINERSVAGRTEVIVHKGQYYAGVSPDVYVGTAGEPQSASLIVVDWNSDPVANQEVSVQIVERRWNSVREEDESGRIQWTWSVEEIPVGNPITVTTDEKGKASVEFTPPKGGTYKIRATVTDAKGNAVSGSAFMWVSSREFIAWRQANNDRIELIADKDTYRPGETAEILIASPFAGNDVQALITVERGSILHHEILTLSSNSTVYKLPITGDLAPNIFVSVVLIKGVDETNPLPAFKMGMVKLDVDPSEQTILLTVTPDREQVGPREEVTYRVEATDYAGNPVDAEVSLALVDLAALSLARPNSGPIVEHFYGNQSLGVRTAMPLVYLVARLNQELFDKGKGGGGGGEEGFFDIRSEFEDTAYWKAKVQTGEDGVAEVTIKLPDNLTTWRMDARAVTQDTLVGQAQVDIVATKPLLIRPVTPRFFVVGDEAVLTAVVNNNTQQDIEAAVALEGTGLAIIGEATHTITIPAGGRVEVVWPVVVGAKTEWVDLVFSAQGGGLSDASKPPLGDPANDQMIPVYRYEVPETVGTAGQLLGEGERTEGIVLPPTYDVTQGSVRVQIDPSLAASTLDGLKWLNHYPYECTEQVVSKFLPNALTLVAFRQFGLVNQTLEANLQKQVNIGLQKLYAQQHVDGGWGWTVQSSSNSTVTAYVVQGFLAAQEAGISIEQRVLDDGIQYLKGHLQSLSVLDEHYELNRQAYVLYVLAKAGEPDVSRTVQLYDARAGLQHWAEALLAQTLWMIDPEDVRLDEIKSDLVNEAILSATGAHWEEDQTDWWNWNTDTRSTGIILDTFALLWPENDLAPNTTRWLMVAREGGHWETTQETVWALIGLTDWMVATRELEADYDWEFTFNGQSFASGHASRDNVDESTVITIDVAELLKDEVNRLTFERSSGLGRMYYTAHLTAYLPVEEVEALSRGVIVSRRYLDESGQTVTQGRVGDILTVELNIIAPNDLYYVVVEDYYPAGAEAVDTGLLTESVLGERPTLKPSDPLRWGWGWWWFSNIDLKDEKAILYADFLKKGTYQFTYQIRLGLAGQYRVIPPVGWEFYFPEVYGRGEGMLFTILPE